MLDKKSIIFLIYLSDFEFNYSLYGSLVCRTLEVKVESGPPLLLPSPSSTPVVAPWGGWWRSSPYSPPPSSLSSPPPSSPPPSSPARCRPGQWRETGRWAGMWRGWRWRRWWGGRRRWWGGGRSCASTGGGVAGCAGASTATGASSARRGETPWPSRPVLHPTHSVLLPWSWAAILDTKTTFFLYHLKQFFFLFFLENGVLCYCLKTAEHVFLKRLLELYLRDLISFSWAKYIG